MATTGTVEIGAALFSTTWEPVRTGATLQPNDRLEKITTGSNARSFVTHPHLSARLTRAHQTQIDATLRLAPEGWRADPL